MATEGIAASISITGFRIACKWLGASSERKAAVRMPNGTAMAIEPRATSPVLASSGRML